MGFNVKSSVMNLAIEYYFRIKEFIRKNSSSLRVGISLGLP